MDKAKVSIIICHHKGRLIDRCIKSLENVNAQKIVVTSDITLQHYGNDINIYQSATNEPTLKRNKGSFFAEGKYLVFMDDDVEIQENCIYRMTEYLDDNHDVAMVYTTLYKMDNHNVIDTSGSYLSWCGFLYETYYNRAWWKDYPILSGKSALCMIRQNVFYEVGQFDEDFVIYGEETDLSWRVWLAGYKVMVLPSAIGYHAFETSLKPRSYYNQQYIHYHGCKNYITMLIKNLPANRLYIVIINAFIWFIMACALWFRSRKGAKFILQGIWYNIRNIKYIWHKRKLIKRTNKDYWKYIYKSPSLRYYFNRFRDYLIHQLHG